MKKFFVCILMSLAMIIGVSSCKCTSDKQTNDVATTEIVVENTISTDREAMYLKAADEYRWYETCIKLNNWLDEENDGSFEMVVNVFQAIEEKGEGSFDTVVYKFQHFSNGDATEEFVEGFWIEDFPLNEESVVVTYKEAYEKVMAVNLPKPHTRNVVLRKMVGPVEANPQWIFGNLHSQIYVDAVTGEVSDHNPSFKATGFKMPLGEWP